jgi:hypothetical protein
VDKDREQEMHNYSQLTKGKLEPLCKAFTMMATRPECRIPRMPKSKRRSQSSSRRLGALWPEIVDADESARDEETDSLLLSSLKYWEVERDLIEERLEGLGVGE